jgi:hypothetical protein
MLLLLLLWFLFVVGFQRVVFDKWIHLVQTSGIFEHYNPLTGEPYGPAGLGMSTLVCDYIYRYGLDQQ